VIYRGAAALVQLTRRANFREFAPTLPKEPPASKAARRRGLTHPVTIPA